MSGLDKKKVVVVGGGTGTHTLLTGLKQYRGLIEVTAVVTMADSGGPTGKLRDEFGYLPVGDVRMALAALAKEDDEHDSLIRKLFLHRFDTNGEMGGHNFGNLFLVALTDILGSEEKAIEAASRVLNISGKVLPVTTEDVQLVAQYEDGMKVTGEHDIDEPKLGINTPRIKSLTIEPQATLNPNVRRELLEADLIVFGPGDLYTSVLANCVVDGFKDAVTSSNAKKAYVANLMTKVGQTTDMGVKEHVEELSKYIGNKPDFVFVNNNDLPTELLKRYETENEFPVCDNCGDADFEIYATDLLASEEIVMSKGDVLRRSLIRHDSSKLARVVYEILQNFEFRDRVAEVETIA